jgi:hypothetical protein
MAVLIAFAVAVVVGLVALWATSRSAITIAVVEVKNGKLDVTRGGLNARALQDLRDVVGRPRISRCTLRIVRAKDHARVEIHGAVAADQAQRIRNVVGNVPLARLAAPKRGR